MSLIPLLLLIASAQPSERETFPTLVVGTNTYRNVWVSSSNPLKTVLRFDGGGKQIDTKDLPEPLRSRYYDPAAEDELIEKRRKVLDNQFEAYKEQNLRVLSDGTFSDPKKWDLRQASVVRTNRTGTISVRVIYTREMRDPDWYPTTRGVNSRQRIGAYSSGSIEQPRMIKVEETGKPVNLKNFTEPVRAGQRIWFRAAELPDGSFDCGIPYRRTLSDDQNHKPTTP